MAFIKILIIEDDLFYQTYVNDLLKDEKVDVTNAQDGEQGIRMAVSEKPDVILTDIEIPKIQGFVLLRHLKERPETARIPVIMMSGKVEKDLFEKHAKLKIHADGYLLKPFSRQELLEMIGKVVSARDGGGGDAAPGVAEPLGDQGRWDPSGSLPDEDEAGTGSASPQPRTRLKPLALVVDDSSYVCDLTQDYLKNEGFSVAVAMDGEEGLRLVGEKMPDVVLLDIQMPGMDGFEVCEALKSDSRTSRIPIILMSAVVDMGTIEKHPRLSHHPDAYLQKPFKKNELLDLIYEHLPTVSPYRDVESKTGFIVPGEKDIMWPDGDRHPMGLDGEATGPTGLSPQERVGAPSQSEEKLARELQMLRVEYDQFREKALADAAAWTDERGKINEKMVLATKRAEESGDSLKNVQREADKLRMNLEAALAAKREVEDQATAMAESVKRASQGHGLDEEISRLRKENIELRSQAAEAHTSIKRAETLEALLAETQEENRQLRESLSFSEGSADLKDQIGRYQAKMEEIQGQVEAADLRRAEAETEVEKLRQRNRKLSEDLEARQKEATSAVNEMETLRVNLRAMEADAADSNRKVAVLESDLERHKVIGEQESRMRRELEERLFTVQNENRVQAGELVTLREGASEMDTLRAKVSVLTREKQILEEGLRKSMALQATAGRAGEGSQAREDLSGRLTQLEEVLKRTVNEAQQALLEQKGREEVLQGKHRELMEALERERSEHKREREGWRDREEDLKKMVEDFLDERRRTMGDEIARMFPVHVRGNARPYEVVSKKRRFGQIALVVLLAVVAFLLGYLTLSTMKGPSVNPPRESGTHRLEGRPGVGTAPAGVDAALLSPATEGECRVVSRPRNASSPPESRPYPYA
ncbi:MAG: response regulator [bacterium]|nr:MAG: response regulator [bacterium]